MSKPIWIVSDLFEGHQGHWADCFFDNATRANIEFAFQNHPPFNKCKYTITEMTDEQIAQYPDIVSFCDWLIETYGSI